MIDVKTYIDAAASGLERLVVAGGDPKVIAGVAAAAVIVRLVSRLMDGRSPAEVVALIEKLAAEGATPIAKAELDAQLQTVLAGLPK